jgi:multidrug efflux pump subunit AcrA (membrane-fusion protein)
VRVRTGISDGSSTEIVEGELQPGDVVITDAAGPPSGFAAAMRRGL